LIACGLESSTVGQIDSFLLNAVTLRASGRIKKIVGIVARDHKLATGYKCVQ